MSRLSAGRNKKRRLLAGVLTAVVMIVLFGIVLFAYEKRSQRREEKGEAGRWNEEDGEIEEQDMQLTLNDQVYAYSDQLEAYLLIGTDNSGENPEAVQGFNGNLADFLVLLLVDHDSGKYGFIQIDRDTITDVPILDEQGDEIGTALEQICTAHWYGQNEEQRNTNTVYTVSQVFGDLPIDGYYCMNMKDIQLLNHAVGGVTVTIEDDLQSVDPDMVPGASIHLTDEQAEKFVRARMSVGDGTNISRLKRQRQYMENLFGLVQQRLSENASYINDLYRELRDVLETDQTNKTVSRIAVSVHDCDYIGILTIDGESREGSELGDGELHKEFYVDEASIVENLGKIIDLRDVTEEVITEDEQMILQEELSEDEEILSE